MQVIEIYSCPTVPLHVEFLRLFSSLFNCHSSPAFISCQLVTINGLDSFTANRDENFLFLPRAYFLLDLSFPKLIDWKWGGRLPPDNLVMSNNVTSDDMRKYVVMCRWAKFWYIRGVCRYFTYLEGNLFPPPLST